jgi:hypothetical protein
VATGAAWLKAGTHREEEKNKNILTGRKKEERRKKERKKERRKTYLTLTGLLMEGLDRVVCR